MAGLLARNARPTDADIAGAITNLCRCGVYPRIVPALRRVTGPVSAAQPTPVAQPSADAPAPGEDTDNAASE